jgi:hypothetical protein
MIKYSFLIYIVIIEFAHLQNIATFGGIGIQSRLTKYQMHDEQSITKIVIQCVPILHKILYMILNLIWKINIKDI